MCEFEVRQRFERQEKEMVIKNLCSSSSLGTTPQEDPRSATLRDPALPHHSSLPNSVDRWSRRRPQGRRKRMRGQSFGLDTSRGTMGRGLGYAAEALNKETFEGKGARHQWILPAEGLEPDWRRHQGFRTGRRPRYGLCWLQAEDSPWQNTLGLGALWIMKAASKVSAILVGFKVRRQFQSMPDHPKGVADTHTFLIINSHAW